MRRRIAVPLIAAVAAAPWLWFYPAPTAETTPARLSAVIDVPREADWLGGMSGIELSEDGARFHVVTDRGHIARGRLERQAGQLTGYVIEDARPLLDSEGRTRDFPHTDAEGIAIDAAGRVFVSFEHAHRILRYDGWDVPAAWPSYTTSWRALSRNGGLEALAVDATGTVFALPEAIAPGASEALVYKRLIGPKWEQPFTIPVDPQFRPVGADFGPDGLFYLLERGVYPFGFFSRVRRMSVTGDVVAGIEIVMETPLGKHGNLEGLAVWRDPSGATRLTMVSDDNFYPFMRGEIVEYVLDPRVATTAD